MAGQKGEGSERRGEGGRGQASRKFARPESTSFDVFFFGSLCTLCLAWHYTDSFSNVEWLPSHHPSSPAYEKRHACRSPPFTAVQAGHHTICPATSGNSDFWSTQPMIQCATLVDRLCAPPCFAAPCCAGVPFFLCVESFCETRIIV